VSFHDDLGVQWRFGIRGQAISIPRRRRCWQWRSSQAKDKRPSSSFTRNLTPFSSTTRARTLGPKRAAVSGAWEIVPI